MVSEAEKYAEDDRLQKERIEAKNELENYVYSVKSSVEQLKDTLDEADLATVEEKVKDAIQWLDASQHASTDEYKSRKEELEGVFTPIITKAYQAGGGDPSAAPGMPPGGMPGFGGAPSGATPGPTVEEVDD